MTADFSQSGESVPDEMAEYLQVFMDETDEQLDGLTETMLVLEREPNNVEQLNEAFRLIHSIKGSAGMMGLDSIAALTHHLESRFERFRSEVARLDEPTMSLVLRCIDFLRECVRRLRAGQALGSSGELLREVSDLDNVPDPPPAGDAEPPAPSVEATASIPPPAAEHEGIHILVEFEPELPLVDLKARLILSRLTNLGDIVHLDPPAESLDRITQLSALRIVLSTEQDVDAIRAAVDVDGVRRVEVGAPVGGEGAAAGETAGAAETETVDVTVDVTETVTETVAEAVAETAAVAGTAGAAATEAVGAAVTESAAVAASASVAPSAVARAKHTETMRVDIERLDSLMNLAGELVINRARFVEVASNVRPVFGRRNVTGRMRDFGESLRRTIEHLQVATNGEWAADIEELRSGLGLLEEQAEVWNNGRQGFTQIGEAIDQLTRISSNLQQSVLDTRMVPVAPLFNRFKRVIRDLSTERGKKVELEIRGEKTELDKRMIDELGEPLVHLVRNSIDHGLEAPDVRRARGKPETGTIVLEASHSGNNIFVHIRDDGGGIDVGSIKSRIVERGLLDSATAEELTDAQAMEYIWHAGFSTAAEVTDVSGRGVGMDAVKTRINDLNGKVDVESTPNEGTTFTIRLPLTLAIINSLLIRVRDIVFSIPIDDVREIVAVEPADVVAVHGKHAIDVRGEFIPLVGIDQIFDWRGFDDAPASSCMNGDGAHAVILQAGDHAIGLSVQELLGSQDIVIKSLSENFVHIAGLSGASILGDGTVCLMLDVPSLMDLAINRGRNGS